MTLPGNLLKDSVDRLAATINASQAHSKELQAASLGQPVTPVTIGEVSNERPNRGDENPA